MQALDFEVIVFVVPELAPNASGDRTVYYRFIKLDSLSLIKQI